MKDQLKLLEEKIADYVIQECEVYSRVTGYMRPVKQWNAGKREEMKARVTYDESVKTIY